MAILTQRVTWRRARRVRPNALTPEQHAYARHALLTLRDRYGSSRQLAKALAMGRTAVSQAIGNGRLSVNTVLRIARHVGVTPDDVLTGAWPPPKPCPTCGRSG